MRPVWQQGREPPRVGAAGHRRGAAVRHGSGAAPQEERRSISFIGSGKTVVVPCPCETLFRVSR